MKYSEFFPYENFRYQQENIIRKVEKASKERKNILLVAPNGTGKTIIALSALLPIAYEENLKILSSFQIYSKPKFKVENYRALNKRKKRDVLK